MLWLNKCEVCVKTTSVGFPHQPNKQAWENDKTNYFELMRCSMGLADNPTYAAAVEVIWDSLKYLVFKRDLLET